MKNHISIFALLSAFYLPTALAAPRHGEPLKGKKLSYTTREIMSGSHISSLHNAASHDKKKSKKQSRTKKEKYDENRGEPFHTIRDKSHHRDRSCTVDDYMPTAPGENNTTQSDIGINFTGVTLADNYRPYKLPPDTIGAIGPEQYLTVLNNTARTFKIDREKGTAEPDDVLDISFQGLTGFGCTDPRVRYDQFEKKWLIIIITVEEDFPIPAANKVIVMVSDGPVITPCTKWTFVVFNPEIISPTPEVTDTFFDYETIGVDQYNYYIGGNAFLGPFIRSDLLILNKESIFNGNEVTITAFRELKDSNGELTFTPQPADNFDKNPEFGYVIALPTGSIDDILTVYKVINPNSLHPLLSEPFDIDVPSFGFSASGAPHKGNIVGDVGGTSGNRLFMSHVRNGNIYTAHTIYVNQNGVSSDDNDRFACRWYEIDVIKEEPSILQIGTIFDPRETDNPRFYFFPAIMTNKDDDLTVSCSVSSAEEYINVATFRRKKDDPLCSIGPEQRVTNSNASYNVQPAISQRWDDYTYTSLDPINEIDMWTIQEWTYSIDNWGVQITQLKPQA